MELFDTHFHPPATGTPEEYAALLPSAVDFHLLAMGDDLGSSLRAQEFARAIPRCHFACGVHPHDAENFDGNVEPFRAMLRDPLCKAVGELGLDYFYDLSPRLLQQQTFERFLGLALESDLPAVVHLRDLADRNDAYDDAFRLLKPFADAGGCMVIHCFAGNAADAERFLGIGAYLGVTGMVTFKKAENVRAVARLIPADRLLIETDAPYLAPVPYRGRENHSRHLVEIAAFLAEIRQLSMAELAELTTRNAQRFLRLED